MMSPLSYLLSTDEETDAPRKVRSSPGKVSHTMAGGAKVET